MKVIIIITIFNIKSIKMVLNNSIKSIFVEYKKGIIIVTYSIKDNKTEFKKAFKKYFLSNFLLLYK